MTFSKHIRGHITYSSCRKMAKKWSKLKGVPSPSSSLYTGGKVQRKALANSDTTSLRPRTNEAAVSVGVCLCKECVWFFFFVFVHVCVWVERYVHLSVGEGNEGIGVGGCGMYRCVCGKGEGVGVEACVHASTHLQWFCTHTLTCVYVCASLKCEDYDR